MERVVCSYCGIPFRTRRAIRDEPLYCCSGCALASRLHIEGDNVPVTPQLLFGLGSGFAMFNQLLLLLLAWALARENRPEAAALFAAISAGIGIAIHAGALAWQWFSRLLRVNDVIVFASSGMISGTAVFFIARQDVWRAAIAALAATGIVAIWQARGFFRKWIAARFRRLEK